MKINKIIINIICFLVLIEFSKKILSIYMGQDIVSILSAFIVAILLLMMIFICCYYKKMSLLNRDYIFIFLLLWFFISGLVNQVRIDVLLVQFRSYFIYFFIVLVFRQIRVTNDDSNKIINFILTIGTALLLVGFWEYFTDTSLLYSTNRYGAENLNINGQRVASLIGNPIDFANVSMFLCLIALYMYLRYKKYKYLLFSAGYFSGVIISGSRGPILAIIITFILMFITNPRVISKLWKLIFILLIPGIYLSSSIINRLLDSEKITFGGGGYRIVFLNDALRIFKDNILFGVGPGRYGGWVSINYHLSEVYSKYKASTFGISSIDMFWPHLLVEIGIVGFTLYILYLISYLIQGDNRLFSFITIIPMILISFSSMALEITTTQLIFCICLGIAPVQKQYVKS